MTSTPRQCSIRARKPACGASLADHEFLACVDRTAATETWESRDAHGRRWLVKVLFGVAGPGADRGCGLVSHRQCFLHLPWLSERWQQKTPPASGQWRGSARMSGAQRSARLASTMMWAPST